MLNALKSETARNSALSIAQALREKGTAIPAQLAENLVESIGHIAEQNLTPKSGYMLMKYVPITLSLMEKTVLLQIFYGSVYQSNVQ
jgi:hypothetical protein